MNDFFPKSMLVHKYDVIVVKMVHDVLVDDMFHNFT